MNQEKVWDEIAVKWSEFRTRIPPTVKNFLEGKKGKILDSGCGTGRNFVKIGGLEWTGTDISGEMLKVAEKVAKKKKMKIKLVKAPASKLPFGDESFDCVLSYAVLHCIDSEKKRKEAVEEIYRVLKKGGEALISSWGGKSPRLKNKGKECFVPWSVRENEGKIERYTYVYDLDEIVELCKKVGFKIVSSWEERNVNIIAKKV